MKEVKYSLNYYLLITKFTTLTLIKFKHYENNWYW